MWPVGRWLAIIDLWYCATSGHMTAAVFSFPVLMLFNLHNYHSVNFAQHFISQRYAFICRPTASTFSSHCKLYNYITLHHNVLQVSVSLIFVAKQILRLF